MTISKTINATEVARNFSDVPNQFKYQETTFDVIRGRDVVARIVSAGPARGLKVSDLNNLFAKLLHLDEGGAEAFEHEIRESVASLTDKEHEWD
jgi:hypothetical protein